MSNFDHVSDLVSAREKIENLLQRLEAAKVDVDKWKLEYSVTVRPDTSGAFQIVVTGTVGQRGFTFTMSSYEVLSFSGDFESLSDIVAQKMLQFLLKEQAEAELRPQFLQACRNIVALSSRSGL